MDFVVVDNCDGTGEEEGGEEAPFLQQLVDNGHNEDAPKSSPSHDEKGGPGDSGARGVALNKVSEIHKSVGIRGAREGGTIRDSQVVGCLEGLCRVVVVVKCLVGGRRGELPAVNEGEGRLVQAKADFGYIVRRDLITRLVAKGTGQTLGRIEGITKLDG